MRASLDKIKFSWDARVLGVANKNNGQLFFINNFDTLDIQVWSSLKIKYEVLCLFFFFNELILIIIKNYIQIFF